LDSLVRIEPSQGLAATPGAIFFCFLADGRPAAFGWARGNPGDKPLARLIVTGSRPRAEAAGLAEGAFFSIIRTSHHELRLPRPG
jgi:hypothetical protein